MCVDELFRRMEGKFGYAVSVVHLHAFELAE